MKNSTDFEFLVELYSAGVDSLARAFESKEKGLFIILQFIE
jgi:hypothetical protein